MDATIDLALVTAFVAVGESASFSAASKKLGVATATISRDVAKLEELVGTELIHRTTRRVSLSTAGQALFERAASHVRAVQAALKNLPERQEEPAGVLRLTAPFDLGVTLLGDVVARFVALYPQVRVDLDLSNRNVDIVAEGFDLALRGAQDKQRDSSLTIRRLINAELRCYASPSYLARRGSPRAVGASEHDWLLFGAMRKQLNLPPDSQPRIVGNDFLFLREATRAGAGIGVLPTFIADPLVGSGNLTPVLPSVRIKAGALVLLHPATGPVARKVTAFRDLLLATLKSGL
jgi:DNA-binding transcriptional LysR family regulator